MPVRLSSHVRHVSSGVCVTMPKLASHILLCLYCSHECEKCRAAEQDSVQGMALPLNLIVDKV